MILNYKTGKLPPNFIYLGALLFGISIWRMVVLDWSGLVYFIISLLFLFIRSGLIIDTDHRTIKKYIGFFVIKIGEWESIKTLQTLRIIKTMERQAMRVLTLSKTETKTVYKLLMVLSDRTIELMSGEKDVIISRAEKISSSLQIPLDNNTK